MLQPKHSNLLLPSCFPVINSIVYLKKTHTTTLNIVIIIVNNNNNNNHHHHHHQFLSTPCSTRFFFHKNNTCVFSTCLLVQINPFQPFLSKKNASKRHFHCYFEALHLEAKPRTGRSLPVALQTLHSQKPTSPGVGEKGNYWNMVMLFQKCMG